MLVSRLLHELARRSRLVVMVPESLAESLETLLPPGVEIFRARYSRAARNGGLRSALLKFFDAVFYFTFANTDQLPNATAEFHRAHHLKWARNKPLPTRLAAHAKVALGRFCSRSRSLRALAQRLYFALAQKELHRADLDYICPDLAVGCSFGMGIEDALFLVEAKHQRIPSAVVVQTWDRTSNKGYPTIHPDYALVWNEVMKRECIVQLEFRPDAVFVEGAPLWDQHFRQERQIDEKNWRQALGIAADRKVVFYAGGDLRCHKSTLLLIPQVFSLANRDDLPSRLHVVFRPYPLYFCADSADPEWISKRHEMQALLAEYEGRDAITIARPQVAYDGRNFFPTVEDERFMLSCLAHCDISMSQRSSQMIEASIFDKPGINLAYGRYRTELYDFEMSQFQTEHLLRIYRANAIYSVFSFEEMIATLTAVLEKPNERAEERRKLVDQEAPVNRGTAAVMTAERLVDLAEQAAKRQAFSRSDGNDRSDGIRKTKTVAKSRSQAAV